MGDVFYDLFMYTPFLGKLLQEVLEKLDGSWEARGRRGVSGDGGCPVLAHWLWNGGLGLMTLALVGALALIVALVLGWNSPRPTRAPDWQPHSLPLRLEATSNEAVVTLLGHPGSDFTLEGEAVPLSGPNFNGYGLVYRAQDGAHYYVFAVGGDGYYAVLRVAGGEETALVDWQQFPHVRRGQQTNRLRVACAGPTCHFYVNDEYATTVEDGTWLTGDVGLWVRGFGDGGAAVHFVDVRVWEMDRGFGEN